MSDYHIEVPNEDSWKAVTVLIAPLLRSEVVQQVVLSGELGSGKTFFVRELLKSLGFLGSVSSPSYVLEHRYQIPGVALPVAHWDLYRLGGETPEELLTPAESEHRLIEWGELSATVLAAATVKLKFDYREAGGRVVHIQGM